MSLLHTWVLLGLAGWPGAAHAQLQLIPDRQPQSVFAGQARKIALVWRNPGDQDFDREVRARLLQTSSATVMPVSDTTWKQFRVLPRQTILESATLDFPAVRAESKFLVQWLVNSNHVLGEQEIWVYPSNLLAELRPLAGAEPLGVIDPQNQLKPLLQAAAVEFQDLADAEVEDYRGKLVIAGPFQNQEQARNGLATQLKAAAKKGAGVVWLLPPREREARRPDKLHPSFYAVAENTNAVVVVQSDSVADLESNPQSQLNLIYFCKLAMNPQPQALPDLAAQP